MSQSPPPPSPAPGSLIPGAAPQPNGPTGAAGSGITPDQAVAAVAQHVQTAYANMKQQMAKVIVGQTDAVELIVLAMLCQGHCILEGVPGLAKTLMISNLAKLLTVDFGRIQFTPDLMPSDITGTEILEEDRSSGHREMRFVKGPIFTNILLADEVNRTPPKTQAALLQAMQERTVTVAGMTYPLEPPFFVLGTQNPIESEGTYPLPEAQLDRFMFKVQLDYPSQEEEIDIAMSTTGQRQVELTPVMTRLDILKIQELVRQVIIARPVAGYAVRLVRATRPNAADAKDYVKHYVTWGAGPRACQSLLLGAKARALLDGRPHASIDDIRSVAKPVLRHRLVANFTAESEGVSTDDIIEQLVRDVAEAG